MDPISTPTPAAPTLTPPPTITAADIVGPGSQNFQGATPPPAAPVPGLPPVTPPTAEVTAEQLTGLPNPPPAEGAPAPTPAPVNPNMHALGSMFGLDDTTLSDPATASTTLKPILDMMARAGRTPAQPAAPAQPNPAPQTPQAQPPAPATPDLSFEGIDFSEAGPGIEKAFKALSVKNQEAMQEAQAAKEAALQAQQHFQTQQEAQHAQEQSQMYDRAFTFLDGLQDPTFGVGAQRTPAQTYAAEHLMMVAGDLARGFYSHGHTPDLEQIMQAALVYTGHSPTGPATPAPAPVVPGALAPQTVATGLPPIAPPARTPGSAGGATELMGNQRFMDGARQILGR